MTSNLTSEHLQSSTLRFGVIAAVLSSLFAYLMWMTGIYGSIELALLEVPATILTSVLCWWLCIVHPQRVSILRGDMASLLSGICGHLLFMIWLFMWPTLLVIYQHPILFLPMLVAVATALAVFIIPLGALFFLISNASGLIAGHQSAILSKLRHQHIAVLSLLVTTLLIVLTAFITPLGALFVLMWASPGGLLAWHLHHRVLSDAKIDQQAQVPLQQASQHFR
jgi:hypothetical protein